MTPRATKPVVSATPVVEPPKTASPMNLVRSVALVGGLTAYALSYVTHGWFHAVMILMTILFSGVFLYTVALYVYAMLPEDTQDKIRLMLPW